MGLQVGSLHDLCLRKTRRPRTQWLRCSPDQVWGLLTPVPGTTQLHYLMTSIMEITSTCSSCFLGMSTTTNNQQSTPITINNHQ